MPSHSGLWRTVRVFISSTFRDMRAERDHLVRVVFPALRECLRPHRVHLIDVDLRWGVTREQAENDRAVELCLRQVDECRPFFLALFGQRYGWVPAGSEWSVTEREVRHALRDGADRPRALFAFRDEAALDTVPEAMRPGFVEEDAGASVKLADLKRRLRESSWPRLDPYPCFWNDALGRLDGLESFGDGVTEWLWRGIREHLDLADEAAPGAAGSLAEDAEQHELFLETRQRVFVGRDAALAELEDRVLNGGGLPCVLTGASGEGKSATLSRFVTTFRRRHPAARVVPHVVGASAASTSLRGLLRRLCLELGDQSTELAEEPLALAARFRELLWRQSPSPTPTLLVIDGLNQLDSTDQAHALHWLPETLPSGVSLVVSCLDGSAVHDNLRSRARHEIRLVPLTDTERLAIVREVPSLSAKALDEKQVGLLLSNSATTNPLFLLTALEELRGFGSFERLTERIAGLPRSDDPVSLLFDQVLERLEQDFNEDLVRTVLGLLASSRSGLAEAELRTLTGDDDLYPVLRQLRPYLLSRGGLLGFYQGDLERAVRRRYLSDVEARRTTHLCLAGHFSTAAEERRLVELPWQLAEAGAWERLYQLLAELAFLDAAWREDPFEVKRFWARLEESSAWRRVEAYRSLVESPGDHSQETVGRVATLLADTGHPREAFVLRQHLVRHYRAQGDPARLASALGNEALMRKAHGDLDGSLRLLAEAEGLWRTLGDAHGLQTVLGNRARVLKMLGDLGGAMTLLREAEEICRRTENRHGLQIALGHQALILQARGDLEGAMALLAERERLCRETGNSHGLQIALGGRALVHQARGEYDQALELLGEQERICRELGNRHGLQVALGNRASVLQRQGRHAEALTVLCQQETICRETGNRLGLQIALTTRALIHKAAGQRGVALGLLREAERICRELRHPEGLALSLHHQAALLDGEAAEKLSDEAKRLAERHGLTALEKLIRDGG